MSEKSVNYVKKDFKLLGGEEKENILSNILMYALIFVMLSLLIIVGFFQLCGIVGDSMQNTVFDNDSVLVTKYSTNYKNKDVIILDMNDGNNEKRLIKRIVATEGETFSFNLENGFIYLYKKNSDGVMEKIDESGYIKETMLKKDVFLGGNSPYLFDTEYTVDPGCYLFLGDNRNNSLDSRYYGFAKKENIIGKVVFIASEGTLEHKLLNFLFNLNSTVEH